MGFTQATDWRNTGNSSWRNSTDSFEGKQKTTVNSQTNSLYQLHMISYLFKHRSILPSMTYAAHQEQSISRLIVHTMAGGSTIVFTQKILS